MKRLFFVLLLILIPQALAADFYFDDSLNIQMSIAGGFSLVPDGDGAKVEEVSTELLLFPHTDYRQSVLSVDTEGKVKDESVSFVWNSPQLGEKDFHYTANVNTVNQRLKVKNKIPFPLSDQDVVGLEQYLQPTITIDSNNPEVIKKAAELADGEDDLFKVAFNLANWVESNVKYDLNTVTAKASKSASWVLQNKQGVCDEMTSLFVAMARSLGIPARFVSGISYSTSPLFPEPWQPHGWAEAYFPEVGWVSFDITFGEYGYIDVTHVKFRDGFDPAEPATTYHWVSHNVELQAKELDFDIQVTGRGSRITEDLLLEQEVLSPSVDFGSYNLVKGIIKNTGDYYAATTLQLAIPSEVEVLGRNRRTILLDPKQVRETYWIVRVKDDLNPHFSYEFPSVIYSEKNVSIRDSFSAKSGEEVFSKEEIEQLTVEDEDKTYSRKVSIDCSYPENVKLYAAFTASCTLRNRGNANLDNIRFCLDDDCKAVSLPINQQSVRTLTIPASTVGRQKLIVSAVNTLVEKRGSFSYQVVDDPALSIVAAHLSVVHPGESFDISLDVMKTSFSVPENIVVSISHAGFENTWEIANFQEQQRLTLTMDKPRLSRSNSFLVKAVWQDSEGKIFSDDQEILIDAEPLSFKDRITLFFNGIINAFYSN